MVFRNFMRNLWDADDDEHDYEHDQIFRGSKL